jgi:HlyD family secretion protein
VQLDDSVQRATAQQLRAQAAAAQAALDELKAQPRPETLAVAQAQVDASKAQLATAKATLEKQQHAWDLDHRAISRDTLDNAIHAADTAAANLEVARKQRDLTQAGAWKYDILNQANQLEALTRAADSAAALVAQYTIRAPRDGVILSIQAGTGSYASPQGTYDTYTQSFAPLLVMGAGEQRLNVRCYIDEILIPRLPGGQLRAVMYIRGTNVSIPLEFQRVQPYVSPKIQLSNARTERVDLRVLPVIFSFQRPADVPIFPGQLVDVYVEQP